MKYQKVVVDIWKMFYSSTSYLVLAFLAYILLKLVNACFWLPSYLQKQDGDDDRMKASIKEEFEEELLNGDEKEADKEPSEPEDKKSV